MNRPKVKVQDKDKQCRECHGTGRICEYGSTYVNCEHICPMCGGTGEMNNLVWQIFHESEVANVESE